MAAGRGPGTWPGGKVPPHVLEYVDWLITPTADRQPPTKHAWAQAHGVADKRLWEWEHDDRVRWAIRERADKLNLAPDRIQQVMNALYAAAAAGDVAAAKLYLAWAENVSPPRPTSSVMDLSDEELEAQLATYGFERAHAED